MNLQERNQSSTSTPAYLRTKDFAKRNPVCIEETATLAEALNYMKKHHVGNVVVVKNTGGKNKPVGIVTDRDIALLLSSSSEKAVKEKTVSAYVTEDLVTASADDDVFAIIELMQKGGVGRIPLVDDEGELVGIVTAKNLLQKLVKGVGDLAFISDRQKENENKEKTLNH